MRRKNVLRIKHLVRDDNAVTVVLAADCKADLLVEFFSSTVKEGVR